MVAPNVSSPLAVQEFTSTKTKDVQMTDATLSLNRETLPDDLGAFQIA